MSKVYILLFFLVGCSSSSHWVKNGSPTYDIDEFEAVIDLCDYKNKMRTSNKLMMEFNNTPPLRVPSAKKGDFEQNERIKIRDEKIIKANSSAKSRSLYLVRTAYRCMEEKGFKKVISYDGRLKQEF
jgi:hypothetical protein